MIRPKSSELLHVQLSALPGSHVGDCIQEAVVMAVNEGVPVHVRHNGTDYIVDPRKIANEIFFRAGGKKEE